MPAKIVCIGDNITYGFPYDPETSWVYQVAQNTGLAIDNKGENGDTTGLMAYRFKNDVLDQDPTHVIIMGGSNDACIGESLKTVKDNLQTMIRKAQAQNITPFLALPIPAESESLETNLRIYRSWMIRYARENNINFIDFGPYMIDSITLTIRYDLYWDDIHPNSKGYKLMSTIVQDFLQKFI